MPPRQPRLQQLVQACPFGGVNLELPPWRIEDKDFQNIANFFCTEKDLRTRPEPFFTAVSANAINGQIDGYDIDGIRHFLLATINVISINLAVDRIGGDSGEKGLRTSA